MMDQDWWDDIHRRLNEMSDEEFLELLKESGIEQCPYEDEEEQRNATDN